MDNAYIESFHSLIKREWLNRFKICDYMSSNDYEELYRRLQQNELQRAS
ncbi:hypothetical protein [Acetivibrio ethanolgignens]|nr:hypothetical protein [Acetivibrio ethanolgignens]